MPTEQVGEMIEISYNIDIIKEENEKLTWNQISFYESYSAGYPETGDPILEKHGLPKDWFQMLIERFKEAASVVAGVDKDKMSRALNRIVRIGQSDRSVDLP